MKELFALDWKEMFAPSTPLPEIVVRGSVVYLSLFLLMRFVLKREAGTVGMADLLMVVLIADAAQNAMSSDYRSITDGIILVATIVFWNYALDWLGFRSAFFRRIIQPAPLLLVEDGRMLPRNMRRELIGEEDLMRELRKQGVEELSQVKRARMEGDGHISVIKREPGGDGGGGSRAENKVL